MCIGSRLVARIASRGHAASNEAISDAASITCSQLSRTRSVRFAASSAVRVSRSSSVGCDRMFKTAATAGKNERGIAHRRQTDEEDPVGEIIEELAGDLQRQPGLAAAAWSGQCHQPRVLVPEHARHRGQLIVATDERQGGTTRFVGWCGSERNTGKRSGNPGAMTWKISCGCLQVAQCVLAERSQRYPQREVVPDETAAASETRIWPPWAALSMRDKRFRAGAR